MTIEETRAKYAALEAAYRADDTDWESFFQAVELLPEIQAADQADADARWEDSLRRVESYKPPGYWKWLWNTITRKDQR